MSIFSNILAKIFPPSHPAVVDSQAAPASATPASASSPAAAAPAAPVPPPTPVDVEAVVSALPGAGQLNWRTSIVDLLKLLGLDGGLDSRKALAKELG